jgi:hypothetical protein
MFDILSEFIATELNVEGERENISSEVDKGSFVTFAYVMFLYRDVTK